MKLTPQDELIKIRQEMLAKEVDAELKKDQIKAFWKKYRFLFIGLACAAVIFVIAFEFKNILKNLKYLFILNKFNFFTCFFLKFLFIKYMQTIGR